MEIKTTQDLIDFCFKAENKKKDESLNSILYLLRREIKHCFGINPDNETKNGIYVKWPGTMAIMAGIDLLSKYHSGTLDFKVGPRFKIFLKEFWNLNDDEQEVIWQLRNSLCHSFSLYSISDKGKEYRFELAETSDNLIANISQDTYRIALNKLLEFFFDGIIKYHSAVSKSDDLKTKLVSVLRKIGGVSTK